MRSWGSLGPDKLLTGGSLGAGCGRGLHWDQASNALWWSYGDIYVPVQKHPTLGCAVLTTRRHRRVLRTWRTEWSSQRTRGAFCTIPDTFAAAYTGNKNTAIMSGIASGSADSPWGANLSAMALPNPVTTPADVITTDTHWTVANTGLIFHDLDHRQSRDTRYKACGWIDAV